jgi:hypothetical protein
MNRYTNEKLMQIETNDIWVNKIMPAIHKHRITHGRRVSNLGIPIVYPHPMITELYVLDYYMYNKRQKKGKKFYQRNSLGEIVLPRMYRYIIDKETVEQLFCTETLGKNYNDIIKKANNIAKGVKIFDYTKELDKAPTKKDVMKIARESELMRR